MTDPKVVHSTFVVERSFPKRIETVFGALSKPEKVRQWFAAGDGHELLEFDLKFAEGGTQHFVYRMKGGTPVAGVVIENDATFLEIVPNDRIVMATAMKFGGKRILTSQITFELLPSGTGKTLPGTEPASARINTSSVRIVFRSWKDWRKAVIVMILFRQSSRLTNSQVHK